MHFVGPLMPELPPDSQRPDWWADLEAAKESGRSVVLVTQGTIATNPTELIEPTLRAMEFEDVFVIAAGATRPPVGHTGQRPGREVRSVRTAHGARRRLCHQRRYGGVTIALTNGVPVVSGGTTEDKAEVGGRVAYTGVGINLKTNRPTAEQLRTAIFSVLRDPSYRQRAEEIQHDLAAHDGPAEAADLLERLARPTNPVLRSAS